MKFIIVVPTGVEDQIWLTKIIELGNFIERIFLDWIKIYFYMKKPRMEINNF